MRRVPVSIWNPLSVNPERLMAIGLRVSPFGRRPDASKSLKVTHGSRQQGTYVRICKKFTRARQSLTAMHKDKGFAEYDRDQVRTVCHAWNQGL